jgi:hypothetical protein
VLDWTAAVDWQFTDPRRPISFVTNCRWNFAVGVIPPTVGAVGGIPPTASAVAPTVSFPTYSADYRWERIPPTAPTVSGIPPTADGLVDRLVEDLGKV